MRSGNQCEGASGCSRSAQAASAGKLASLGRGLALTLACGALLLASTSVRPAFAQEDTIVALGDSNTSGFGVDQEEAFPARLQAMLRRRGRAVHVVNAGVPGDTFGGMLDRVDESVPARTRLVIVQGGYNDLAEGVPPEQSFANLRGILAKLNKRHVNAIVCGFFRPKFDAVGRRIAASYHARFVSGSTCYDPHNRGSDGLHMSAQGHQVVAARLAGVVGGPGRTRTAAAHQR